MKGGGSKDNFVGPAGAIVIVIMIAIGIFGEWMGWW